MKIYRYVQQSVLMLKQDLFYGRESVRHITKISLLSDLAKTVILSRTHAGYVALI